MLVIGDDDVAKTEGIKAQAIAKFVGTSFTTRSASTDDEQLTLPCLVVNSRHITGGNVIAKLLLAAAGHTLYPQAPYSPDKRYRSAQIDAWIDYSTTELRTGQVIAANNLLRTTTGQVCTCAEIPNKTKFMSLSPLLLANMVVLAGRPKRYCQCHKESAAPREGTSDTNLLGARHLEPCRHHCGFGPQAYSRNGQCKHSSSALNACQHL